MWTWVDTVTADGNDVDVIAKVVADGSDGKNSDVYYTFKTSDRMTSVCPSLPKPIASIYPPI